MNEKLSFLYAERKYQPIFESITRLLKHKTDDEKVKILQLITTQVTGTKKCDEILYFCDFLRHKMNKEITSNLDLTSLRKTVAASKVNYEAEDLGYVTGLLKLTEDTEKEDQLIANTVIKKALWRDVGDEPTSWLHFCYECVDKYNHKPNEDTYMLLREIRKQTKNKHRSSSILLNEEFCEIINKLDKELISKFQEELTPKETLTFVRNVPNADIDQAIEHFSQPYVIKLGEYSNLNYLFALGTLGEQVANKVFYAFITRDNQNLEIELAQLTRDDLGTIAQLRDKLKDEDKYTLDNLIINNSKSLIFNNDYANTLRCKNQKIDFTIFENAIKNYRENIDKPAPRAIRLLEIEAASGLNTEEFQDYILNNYDLDADHLTKMLYTENVNVEKICGYMLQEFTFSKILDAIDSSVSAATPKSNLKTAFDILEDKCFDDIHSAEGAANIAQIKARFALDTHREQEYILQVYDILSSQNRNSEISYSAIAKALALPDCEKERLEQAMSTCDSLPLLYHVASRPDANVRLLGKKVIESHDVEYNKLFMDLKGSDSEAHLNTLLTYGDEETKALLGYKKLPESDLKDILIAIESK